MICNGNAEANSKFLKSFGANKPTSYIMYLEANNLYRHSMIQLLPTEILDWDNPKDFDLDNYSNDSPTSWFLEVHLYYLDVLHDYPLVGEKMEVRKEMSNYQLQIIEHNNFSLGKNKKNLLPF